MGHPMAFRLDGQQLVFHFNLVTPGGTRRTAVAMTSSYG